MSIEAKPSSNPYDNSQDNSETAQSAEPTKTLTTDQLRAQVRPDHKPTLVEKYKEHKSQFIAGVAISTLLVGGGFTASKVAEGMAENKDEQDPGVTGPEVPGQVETTAPAIGEAIAPVSPSNIAPLETAEPTPAPSADTLSTIGIEANQTDEAMAKDFINSLSSWRMAGATPEAKAIRSSQYGNLTLEAYAEKIAVEQTAIYAPKLFGKDYASNALLSSTVNGITEGNVKNVLAYLQTSGNSNPVNKEPYTRSVIFDEFTPLPVAGADKSFKINFHETDNSDKNIFGAGRTSEVNGKKGSTTLSLKNDNGEMIISSIDFLGE